jgi:hypothetical protein
MRFLGRKPRKINNGVENKGDRSGFLPSLAGVGEILPRAMPWGW